jgi:hypothetical protein
MKKIILTFALVIFLSAFASAQDYNTGVGLRLGFSNGLTIKHFVSQRSAFEGILSTRWRGFELTGLYEVHNNASMFPGSTGILAAAPTLVSGMATILETDGVTPEQITP